MATDQYPQIFQILLEKSRDIEEKLDKNLNETAKNTSQLADHMRRTENLEERMVPIEKHVAMWGGVGKALVVGSTIVAALGGMGTIVMMLLR